VGADRYAIAARKTATAFWPSKPNACGHLVASTVGGHMGSTSSLILAGAGDVPEIGAQANLLHT
jgi:hypothetical protein